MNYKRILPFILLHFVILANVYADEIPVDNDSLVMRYTANEVVIESFKQNNNLFIQPVSATLLSAEEIEGYNIQNIKEVTALIPNLYMPDYGSKMTSPVFIRGIGASKNAPSVGLYVDGVPYFDRSSFDFNMNDIERLEVLRGPQGTLYGRNTMGGIINVFTRSPFKYNGTHLNLSAGNYNTYQTGISHYGKASEKLAYSLSGNYMHTGGYFTNKYTGKRADPIDAISTRGRLSWRVQPRLNIHLAFAYEYSDQDGYPYYKYDKESGKVESIDYNSPSFYRRNMSTNGLTVEYITDYFKLSSQSSFQFFDGKQGLDQDFTSDDNYYVDFYQRQQMYSQEVNIKSLSEDSRYQWQFGLFGFYQNYFQTSDVDNRTGGGHKHTIQDVYNPTGGFAVYHQSTIKDILIRNLSFTLGIRYDWEKTKSTFERMTPTVIDEPMKDKLSFSQVSPKASLQYLFNKKGMTYFSVSRGYKTGGFNNTADKEVKEDRTFDPEYSWSYEVGAKSGFFNNLLFLDLALFYIDWRDQQISQPKTLTNGFILRNAGKTESKGLEFTTQVNPLKNLNFQLSYGYTKATFRDYEKGDIIYNGNYLPMIPRNTLSIASNYTIPVNAKWLDNITFNAQYTGVGKIYWEDENEVSQSYYGMFNGKVSFINKGLSLEFWTKNIGNKDYMTYYFSLSTGQYIQRGKPFTCGMNLNFKF